MQGAYVTGKNMQGGVEFYRLGFDEKGKIPQGYAFSDPTETIEVTELRRRATAGEIADLTAVMCDGNRAVLYPLRRISQVTSDVFLHMAVTTMDSNGRQRTYLLFKKELVVDKTGVYTGSQAVVMKGSLDTLTAGGTVYTGAALASKLAQGIFREGVTLDKEGLHVQGYTFRAESCSTEDEVGSPNPGEAVINWGMTVHVDFSRVVGGVRALENAVFNLKAQFVEVNRDVLLDCFAPQPVATTEEGDIQEEEADLDSVAGDVEPEQEDFAMAKTFLARYVGACASEYRDPRILAIVEHALSCADDLLPGSPDALVVRCYNKWWLRRQGAVRLV